MAGFTNRGKYLLLQYVFNASSVQTPTNAFYIALVTDATAPSADINTLSQLTEIPLANGYSRLVVLFTSTEFDNVTENDTTDQGTVQLKDLTWTAAGGNLPSSGSGASHVLLITDNTTTAEILAYGSLSVARTVTDTQELTLQNWQLNYNES